MKYDPYLLAVGTFLVGVYCILLIVGVPLLYLFSMTFWVVIIDISVVGIIYLIALFYSRISNQKVSE